MISANLCLQLKLLKVKVNKMPKVGMKEFAYTPKGKKDAEVAKALEKKMLMKKMGKTK